MVYVSPQSQRGVLDAQIDAAPKLYSAHGVVAPNRSANSAGGEGGFTSTAFLTYCLSQCYVVTLSRCYDLYFIHCHPSSLDVILENRELAVTFHKSFTNPGARRSAARFEISRRAANVSSLSLSPVRILPFRGQQRQAEERLSALGLQASRCALGHATRVETHVRFAVGDGRSIAVQDQPVAWLFRF